jgi:hypothetical protein
MHQKPISDSASRVIWLHPAKESVVPEAPTSSRSKFFWYFLEGFALYGASMYPAGMMLLNHDFPKHDPLKNNSGRHEAARSEPISKVSKTLALVSYRAKSS